MGSDLPALFRVMVLTEPAIENKHDLVVTWKNVST